ncbi:hypothetical protein MIND_01208300 [Mycena indigotica]|uniref:Uncharacterized protein n=1 Tax=Mycena indigotica TaxID=2126181 RepID=A0A8H6S560_9AGAR|nr:uncharacterized protein MIND_01208300 [Mycena indigotica]KAF7293089.1 hypothetical protein MIND_01208300 [Mycena indigotica]
MGIKVRDFAYPSDRVGHVDPTYSHPLVAAVAEEAEDQEQEKPGTTVQDEQMAADEKDNDSSPELLQDTFINTEDDYATLLDGEADEEGESGPPARVEDTPMPRIPETWEMPHPLLRPVTYQPPHYPPHHVPSPQDPIYYDTHRLPGHFSPILGVVEVEYRLSQQPRTVPILGLTTRRLLTISPDLVDLSRYQEMDLEELRRYDRRLLFQLMNGIKPPRWRCYPLGWAPTPENRAVMVKVANIWKSFTVYDDTVQKAILQHAWQQAQEDTEWMNQEMERRGQENIDAGLLDPANPALAELHDYDIPSERRCNLSIRQWLELWERRLDTGASYPTYPALVEQLKLLWKFDGRTPHNDDIVARQYMRELLYADVKAPFVPGQLKVELPPCQYWGPDAVWDDYRLEGAQRISKLTLMEHIEQLTGQTVEEAVAADPHAIPWPVPTTMTDPRYHQGHMSAEKSLWDYDLVNAENLVQFLEEMGDGDDVDWAKMERERGMSEPAPEPSKRKVEPELPVMRGLPPPDRKRALDDGEEEENTPSKKRVKQM